MNEPCAHRRCATFLVDTRARRRRGARALSSGAARVSGAPLRGDALQRARRRQAAASDPGARGGGRASHGDSAGAGAANWRCRRRAPSRLIHTYSLIHDDLPAMDDDMPAPGAADAARRVRRRHGDSRRRRPAGRSVRAAGARAASPTTRRIDGAEACRVIGVIARGGRRGRHGRRPGDRPAGRRAGHRTAPCTLDRREPARACTRARPAR